MENFWLEHMELQETVDAQERAIAFLHNHISMLESESWEAAKEHVSECVDLFLSKYSVEGLGGREVVERALETCSCEVCKRP